ncbi:MAG: adenylate/guanylate cyclase domain-containing protein [Desulfosarcinaceae bacterium]|nr:adenylate/guanylate cyclase domain-containing protein [Desulfosarcinaceae bacterium]
MEPSTQTIAVLFADICGSTRLYENAGDRQAMTMTASCLQEMENCILRQEGTVIEVRGDGILATFETAEAGLMAARAIRESTLARPLSVHAGIHLGPTLLAGNAIFGDTVNVAARMADLAKANEIMLSQDAYDALPSATRFGIRSLGPVVVKGKTELMSVFLCAHSAPDETIIGKAFDPLATAPVLLELEYAGRAMQLKAATGSLVIGRHAGCGLIVDDQVVSRRHATIESKQGKFFLQDHSSNGTFVTDSSGAVTFLRRDIMQLSGNGTISCGIRPDLNSVHRILFNAEAIV